MKIIVVASPPTSGTTTIIWNPNKIRIPVLSFQIPQSFKVPVKKLCAWSGAPISDPALWWRCFGNAPGRRSTLLPGLAALAIAAAGCHKSPPATESPDIRVEGDKIVLAANAPQRKALTVEAVTERKVNATHLTGRLVWDDEVTVRVFSPVLGRVTAVDVVLGQKIDPGAVLARVSSPDFGQAQADVRKANADLVLAEHILKRSRDLQSHGAAPQKDVEAAEDAQAAAQAEKERTAARLELYGGSTEVLDGLFPLRAPIGGTVVERNVNLGQEVRPDQMLGNVPQVFSPLLTISDPTKLWLVVDATEADMSALKPGQEIHVRAKPFGEREFPGRIEVIGDTLDPATRTLKVRGTVPNPDRLLKAEMYVTVDILTDVPPTTEVPAKAVFLKDNQAYVFIAEGDQFVRRPVKTGAENDGKIGVLEGVRPWERVVTEGCLLLQTLIESKGQP